MTKIFANYLNLNIKLLMCLIRHKSMNSMAPSWAVEPRKEEEEEQPQNTLIRSLLTPCGLAINVDSGWRSQNSG
jgi:hypothetical protein